MDSVVKLYADNIESFFLKATDNDIIEGGQWYHDAHEFAKSLAQQFSVKLETVCGIISALSPQNKWQTNKRDAVSLLADDTNTVKVSTFNKNKEKAIAIKNGKSPLDVLGGKKTRAFYNNILNPFCEKQVTIDRHAVRSALGLTAKNIGKYGRNSHYDKISDAYKAVAKKYDVLVTTLQAIVWIVVRNLLGIKDNSKRI